MMAGKREREERAKEKKKTYEITKIRMRNLSRKATDSWSLYYYFNYQFQQTVSTNSKKL